MTRTKPRFSLDLMAMIFLIPMIPNWGSKKRYPGQPQRYIEHQFIPEPINEREVSKECAICRKGNADYEHSCGVAFHKACIHQYFDAISAVAGAERICPHCYAPMPLDLDEEAAVEVSPIMDEVYNQYLELSDEFSLALIDGRIRDVSVFLESSTNDQYLVNVDFAQYPKKPTFSFPDELLANIDGLDEVLERLNNWDAKFAPRVVDVLLDIQSRIRPKEIQAFGEQEGPKPPAVFEEEKEAEVPEKKEEMEIVEVLPESDIVEVTLEDESENDETPALFFELEPFSEPELPMATTLEDTFENEEAISQYLDISNSFSVELLDDEVYNIIVHLSSLDGGIYNIYPVTINFKNYPEKPQMTFTDELLVRIRMLDEIIITLKFWDAVNPPRIVDILTELETKLMEDSLIENEIEMLKREFATRRINKNRIMVTLTSYGQKAFNVELDIKNYPDPPMIYLPEELKPIEIEELEGIKKWPERPQKRIMDVLRSLSSVINNLYRLKFEEYLLKMVADEYDFSNGEYKLQISVPITKDEEPEDSEPSTGTLFIKIRILENYPLSPPKIEIDSDSEVLKRDGQTLLTYMLKSWSPSMFLVDAVNRLSLSLSNTSLYKCLICGEKECPICGLPLLTQPVTDTQEICEVPCIHCKRPYHVHCLTNAMEDGMKKCGLCLSDLTRFFGKRLNELPGL
jgi:ubiquitin-protein ligase